MAVSQSNVSIIERFLSGYDFEEAKAAFLILSRVSAGRKLDLVARQKAQMAEDGWLRFDGGPADVPKGHDYTVFHGVTYIRTPEASMRLAQEAAKTMTETPTKQEKKKADLSMRETDKLCLTCGNAMVYEPICGGCRLGRIGFAGRYVCTDDMDHEFYVLREGIILPNQGD